MSRSYNILHAHPHYPEKRLFFALWPPRETANEIYAAAQTLHTPGSSRLVRLERLHLTIAFLGSVHDDRLAAIYRAANKTLCDPSTTSFSLHLDHYGQFRKSGIVWLGATKPPEALLHLATTLADKLRLAGFRLEARRFRAHITLLRKATLPTAANPGSTILWPVHELTLVESKTTLRGVNYQILHRWSLAASQTG